MKNTGIARAILQCHCEEERFSATTKQSFRLEKIASQKALAMTLVRSFDNIESQRAHV